MGRLPSQVLTGELAPSVQRYSLSYIRPYHREIARRLVLGQTQAEIARDLDINQGRLSVIVNSPIFQNELARLEKMREGGVEDVTVQLQELAPVALEQVERLMIYGEKESLRLAAAQDILDRAGHNKVTKIDANVSHETHEQRLARLLGISPEEVYAKEKGNDPKEINVTPTNANSVSTSTDDEAVAIVDEDKSGGFE